MHTNKRLAVGTVFILAALLAPCQGQNSNEKTRWGQEAAHVRIVRDDWGIAHVGGETDADAVFGMIYAQCEDDFNRVETNYLNAMGRLAEAEGESKIYQDLRMKMFVDQQDLKKEYAARPPAVAAQTHGRLRGWSQLLPGQTSRGEAARDPTLRALDGSLVYRRQHRRRHRAGSAKTTG